MLGPSPMHDSLSAKIAILDRRLGLDAKSPKTEKLKEQAAFGCASSAGHGFGYGCASSAGRGFGCASFRDSCSGNDEGWLVALLRRRCCSSAVHPYLGRSLPAPHANPKEAALCQGVRPRPDPRYSSATNPSSHKHRCKQGSRIYQVLAAGPPCCRPPLLPAPLAAGSPSTATE